MTTSRIRRTARLVTVLGATFACSAALAQSAGDLRLVSGSVPSEGEVEVYHDGRWGLVCDDRWDLNDAQVACRQAGYARATRATSDDTFSTNNPRQPVWLDEVHCTGTEATLMSCPRGVTVGMSDCGRFEAAGVACEGTLDASVGITLSKTTMTLTELDTTGDTYTVALESAPANDVTLTVSAPEASFITANPPSLTFTPSSWGTAQTVTLTAGADDDTLNRVHYIAHSVTGEGTVPPAIRVEVLDTGGRRVGGELRLTGSDNAHEGKLEVYIRTGSSPGWGLVCGHSWDMVDAGVACRQLGFTGASWTDFSAFYGPGYGRPYHLNDLECKGTESSLISCPRTNNNPLRPGNCRDRGWSAEVRCTGTATTLSVADAEATEGTDDALDFVVTLSAASTEPVVVDYATSDGSASEGSDYTATSGTLTFAAAETSKTVSVPITDDSVEDSGETMTLALSNPFGARLEDGTATGTINNTETGPALTAEFVDLPAGGRHGGEDFAIELRFSEEIPLSWRSLIDPRADYSAFTVSEGSVTRVKRIQGNQRWRVTVAPDGDEDVEITLNPSADCTTRPICASGRRPLAQAVTVSVAGPEPATTPITVAFEDGHAPPAEHDGTSAISFRIAFSENPPGYSYLTLRDRTLRITQGGQSLTPTVKRLASPGNRRWKVTVTPRSKVDLTVAVQATTDCAATGAVCTDDGRMLSAGLEAVVQGPPALSVTDAGVEEAAGATVDFTVRLSRAAATRVTVRYATAEGTATAGSDYTTTSGTLTFEPTETSKTVSVPVAFDDVIDEGEESFTLTLSNASGANAWIEDATATGTISNHDAMPHAWLARFGRTIASQALDTIGGRILGDNATRATVAGHSLNLGTTPLGHGGHARHGEDGSRKTKTRSPRAREILGASAFQLSSGEGEWGVAWTAWGRGIVNGFEADVDEVKMSGKVDSVFIGADAGTGRWLAGLAVSVSEGTGEYSHHGEEQGKVKTSLTSVYPYARMAVNESTQVWGFAGFGNGKLELTEQARPGTGARTYDPDVSTQMGAVGTRTEIVPPSQDGGTALALKSDAFWVRTRSDRRPGLVASRTDATRVRLLGEASRNFDTGSGTLTPTLEFGARYEGGDAETGVGLEIGAGAAYRAGALSLEGRLRALAAHEESGYRDWSASAALRVTPSQSGRGLSLVIAPSWGNTGSGIGQLRSAGDASGPAPAASIEARGRIESEIGFGFALRGGGGVVTPYAGLSLEDGRDETWHTGARWEMAPHMALGLEASARTGGEAARSSAVMLRAQARF